MKRTLLIFTLVLMGLSTYGQSNNYSVSGTAVENFTTEKNIVQDINDRSTTSLGAERPSAEETV